MKQESKLALYNWFTKLTPSTSLTRRVRIWLLRKAGVEIGRGFELGDGVVFRGGGCFRIGSRVRIYDEVYFLCKRSGMIEIGDDVTIGTRAYFESGF